MKFPGNAKQRKEIKKMASAGVEVMTSHELAIIRLVKVGWATAGFNKFVRMLLPFESYGLPVMVPDLWRICAKRTPAEEEFDTYLNFEIQIIEVVHKHALTKQRLSNYTWADELLAADYGWRLRLWVQDIRLGTKTEVPLHSIYLDEWRGRHCVR